MRIPGLRQLRTVGVAVAFVWAVTAAADSMASGMPVAPELPRVQAGTLTDRYTANQEYIARAKRAAEALGDTDRANVLKEFGTPGRQFLDFSPVSDGRAVEVLGDLAKAERIAVFVPGSDSTIDTFDHFGAAYASLNGGARSLHAEMTRLAPDEKTAVVAWLGYAAPRTMSRDVLMPDRAIAGGRLLTEFVRTLREVNATAPVSLVCHSYGSVVCAQTLQGLDRPTAKILSSATVVGSPGMGVEEAADLTSDVPLWVSRGGSDWITRVPHTSVNVFGATIGYGVDPTSQQFGARGFAAGPGGHSEYFQPGTTALRNISLISLGRETKVTHV